MKKRYSDEQIIGFLREADTGVSVKDLCRRHGFSEASFYLWRGKYGGMNVSDAKRLKALEAENARQPPVCGAGTGQSGDGEAAVIADLMGQLRPKLVDRNEPGELE